MPDKAKYMITFGDYHTGTKHKFRTKMAATRKQRALKKRLPYIKNIRVRKIPRAK